jgi:hypothetical protein
LYKKHSPFDNKYFRNYLLLEGGFIMPRKGQTKYNNLYPLGHKFGSWELLDPEPVRLKKGKKNFYYHYLVKCECGAEAPVDCNHLTIGVSTRCYECSMKHTDGSGNPNWKGHGLVSGSRFYRAKFGAEQRNIPFEIDIQIMNEVLEESNFICALSGIRLDKNSWSLDRIDSSAGYTRDNIQYVHKDINRMKNKYSQEYFIKMCKRVAEHN